MNSKTTIIGLVAAIAVLSGAMGLSVTSGGFSDAKIAQYTPATGMLMGQVMIEAHNENGELIAYRLGDNEVVDGGEQCILKMLFASTGGLTASVTDGRGEYASTSSDAVGGCTGVLTGAWDVIAIGTGTTSVGTVAEHDVYSGLELECNAVGNDGNSDGDLTDVGDCLAAATSASKTLVRATATTKTWTNGTGGTDTEIVLAKTFTSGITTSITESGLFNSTQVGGSGMLAHKTFAGVVLANGDSITVQWTFVVGN